LRSAGRKTADYLGSRATKILFIDLSRIATRQKGRKMNSIIYLVGLVVVVLAILSFFGLS
jgi:hypothetical protein